MISTARSGNVLGGGDYSKNRIIPDILKSINNKKKTNNKKSKSYKALAACY